MCSLCRDVPVVLLYKMYVCTVILSRKMRRTYTGVTTDDGIAVALDVLASDMSRGLE